MSDPTEITAVRPPQRYGGGRRRRTPIVLGTALALLLAAWAVWAGLASSDQPIDAQVTSYDVVDSHQVRVKVAAHFRDDKVEGSCLLRATAADHTVVGELSMTADELRQAGTSWIPIRTERRATTATVVRCTT